jgi:hypothetical protein
MTTVAMPEIIAVQRGNVLSFPCASCGANLTVEFRRYDVQFKSPGRVTGYCSCGHANPWILNLDGHYTPATTRRLGIADVHEARRVHDTIWHEWTETLINAETYAASFELDRKCLVAYTIYCETLRQALADAEAEGYERGLEAGRRARAAA